MDVNPADATPKRSCSTKPKSAERATAKPASRARQAKSVDPQVVEVTSITAIHVLGEEELKRMIATAAYYLAERRNFEPGHELDDWLEAERQIHALHL
jgi:hypothetical protein